MNDAFQTLLVTITKSLGYQSNDFSHNALMKFLANQNPELANACSQLYMAVEAWLFSRKDMHLQIKAPDLFKIQKQLFIQNLEQKVNALKPFLIELNLDSSEIADQFKP